MPIHIGNIIKAILKERRLTYKAFGALINKSKQTIPDILKRETMAVDLLVTISVALKVDLYNYYYEEEALKSLREDELTKLKLELQKRDEKIERLQNELALTKDLSETQKSLLSVVTGKNTSYGQNANESTNRPGNDTETKS